MLSHLPTPVHPCSFPATHAYTHARFPLHRGMAAHSADVLRVGFADPVVREQLRKTNPSRSSPSRLRPNAWKQPRSWVTAQALQVAPRQQPCRWACLTQTPPPPPAHTRPATPVFPRRGACRCDTASPPCLPRQRCEPSADPTPKRARVVACGRPKASSHQTARTQRTATRAQQRALNTWRAFAAAKQRKLGQQMARKRS